MINKVIINEHVLGTRLNSNITLEELKELLYKGISIEEKSNSTFSRVLFCWDDVLYIRAAKNILGYVENLPSRLQDSSELDDHHIRSVILKGNEEGSLSLTILSFMPFYKEQLNANKEVLKDIK